MNINKKKLSTKIFATIVAIFMLFVNGGLVLINTAKNALNNFAFADYEPTSVSLSNSSFTSPTSGTYPLSPSSWTKRIDSNGVTSGIISLDETNDDTITNTYKLDSLPYKWNGISDTQVLMINSGKVASSNGYKSSSISLSSSGYYEIKFKAYTTSGTYSAIGSAKLTGVTSIENNSNNLLKISTNDSTSSNWQDYSIYVETNDIESPTVYLELWLGIENGQQSQGAVFFDEISITSYDNTTYNSKVASATSKTSTVINLSSTESIDNITDSSFIQNPSFENGLNGWTVCNDISAPSTIVDSVYVEETNYNSSLTGIETCPTNANVYQNKKALVINNKQSGYIGYSSTTFTVKQNKFYELSFLAKTNSLTSGATVNLVERNPYTNKYLSDGITLNPNYVETSANAPEYTAQTFTVSAINTSSYTNSKTNDWKLYTFYIKSNVHFDSELNLEIWLGTKDSAELGYLFIDNFSLSEISGDLYSTGSSNGTVANLNQSTTDTDFANGTFSLFSTTSLTDTYPYSPSSWTLSQTSSTANSNNGIINTANDNSSLGVPTITPINSSYPNNNVLMIGNVSSNSQSYTSSSVSLSADSYYKIQVSVLTNSLSGSYAGIRLLNGSNVLGEKLNITSNNIWTTYSIYVKTGYEATSVTLALSLGQNSAGTGFAFFDNVLLTSSLTEDDFNNASTLDTIKIDLSQYTFSNIPENSSSTQGVFVPYDFTANNNASTSTETITAGVIDTANYGSSNGYNESQSYTNPGHAENQDSKILMIKSLDDTYYTYTSKVTNALTSGEYYQIDIDVKTTNLSQEDDNIKYSDTAKKKAYPYGASISVSGIDASFTGINTDDYKTYTIYIKCTTDSTISIVLGLGSENAYTSGAVYFSNAKVSKIDADTYTTGIAKLDVDESDIPDNILAIGNTDDTTSDDSSNSNTNDVNFDWLIVPSLITALAIIVAVIGVLVRNIKKNAPKKVVVQKDYSRGNIKKLDDTLKEELKEIETKTISLNKEQDQLAIEINNLKLQKTDENKAKVEKLKLQYEQNNKKFAEFELQKAEAKKVHKQKVKDLMEEKKADQKKTR